MKLFLDLSSSLKLLCIRAMTKNNPIDIECKNLVKPDPKNNTELEKKEAALSSSEALTKFFIYPVHIITDSAP